jgi:hypothetical protein
VIIGRKRDAVYGLAHTIRDMVSQQLKLQIPYNKITHIGADPLPFLGYLIDDQQLQPLARNLRRHRRRITRMERAGKADSDIAKSQASFDAWAKLGQKIVAAEL